MKICLSLVPYYSISIGRIYSFFSFYLIKYYVDFFMLMSNIKTGCVSEMIFFSTRRRKITFHFCLNLFFVYLWQQVNLILNAKDCSGVWLFFWKKSRKGWISACLLTQLAFSLEILLLTYHPWVPISDFFFSNKIKTGIGSSS